LDLLETEVVESMEAGALEEDNHCTLIEVAVDDTEVVEDDTEVVEDDTEAVEDGIEEQKNEAEHCEMLFEVVGALE